MENQQTLEELASFLREQGFLLWRLCKVLPANLHEETIEVITIEPERHTEDLPTDFMVVSQAWQDSEVSCGAETILWNGEKKDVSQDTYELLRSLRSDEDSYFWEQNLCTKKDDDIEKIEACRVAFCAGASARKVIFWLGKQTPSTSLALDILGSGRFSECLDPKQLSQNARQLEAVNELWFKNAMSMFQTMVTYWRTPYDYDPCRVYFRCGSQEIPFSRLYEAWKLWDKSPIKYGPIKTKQVLLPPLFHNIPFFRALKSFEDFRRRACNRPGASQLEWLVHFSRTGLQVNEPQELLIMFQFVASSPSVISKSPLNISMTVKHLSYLIFFEQTGMMEDSKIFSYIRPAYARRPDLCSWAPDFFQQSSRSWPFAEVRDPYNAGLDFNNSMWTAYIATCSRDGSLSTKDRNEMSLQGFTYDKVEWYNDSPDIYEKEVPNAGIEREISRHNYQHVINHVKEHWVARAMPIPAIFENEQREPLWKTLICNRDADGKMLRANSDMGKRFDQWIAHWYPPFTGLGRFPLTHHDIAIAGDAEAQASARLNELQQQAKAAKEARKRLSKELLDEKRELKERLAKYRKEPWVKGFTDLVVQRSYDRALITTEEHKTFGMATRGVQRGDSVVVHRGAQAPLILRKTKDGRHIVIGEAYVHGIMSGEFVRKAMLEKLPVETFRLDKEMPPKAEGDKSSS
ncbi:hypothetical protein F4775DRAFT_588582 [Biscogniauxia sp. FL1348]|nr:hypothetical protein F4775DRAFT_588582 [Biscogniauxia sp. FL1348]